MPNPEFKLVDAAALKMQQGAQEQMNLPEMQPYIRYCEAIITGADQDPPLAAIEQIPLEKRYVWRIASALHWGFCDFDDWSVSADAQTLSDEQADQLVQLLRHRHLQFCLFLKALYGEETMERMMLRAIEAAKGKK